MANNPGERARDAFDRAKAAAAPHIARAQAEAGPRAGKAAARAGTLFGQLRDQAKKTAKGFSDGYSGGADDDEHGRRPRRPAAPARARPLALTPAGPSASDRVDHVVRPVEGAVQ